MPNVPARGPRPNRITKMIAHKSTGMVRMPAAMKRAKLGNPVGKRSPGSENAQRQRRQEAEQRAGKRHLHGFPQSRRRRSAGWRNPAAPSPTPRMPRLRKPRRAVPRSKNPEMGQHRQQKKPGGERAEPNLAFTGASRRRVSTPSLPMKPGTISPPLQREDVVAELARQAEPMHAHHESDLFFVRGATDASRGFPMPSPDRGPRRTRRR